MLSSFVAINYAVVFLIASTAASHLWPWLASIVFPNLLNPGVLYSVGFVVVTVVLDFAVFGLIELIRWIRDLF